MTRRTIEINRDKLIQVVRTQHINLGAEQLPEHTLISATNVGRNRVIEREQVLGVYTIRYHIMLQSNAKTIGYESLLTNLNKSDQREFLLVSIEVEAVVMLVFTDVDMNTLFGILRPSAE